MEWFAPSSNNLVRAFPYRPKVTPDTGDEELFEIMTAMLSHLNDNHVILQAESLGRKFSAGYIGKWFNEMGLSGAMKFLARRPTSWCPVKNSKKISIPPSNSRWPFCKVTVRRIKMNPPARTRPGNWRGLSVSASLPALL